LKNPARSQSNRRKSCGQHDDRGQITEKSLHGDHTGPIQGMKILVMLTVASGSRLNK
jgi:hypothetical protein